VQADQAGGRGGHVTGKPAVGLRDDASVAETLKLLPEQPEPILISHIFEQVSQLGSIHYAPPSTAFQKSLS
jgi:hypothetical protein